MLAMAEQVEEKYRARMTALSRKQFPSKSNRASSLGHPCVRYLYYERTQSHLAAPPSVWLQSLFEEGKRSEGFVRQQMLEVGIDITGYDQVSWPANAYDITGHADTLIHHVEDGKARAMVTELKRVNEHTFNRLRHQSDFYDPDAYFYKWLCQLQTYIFLATMSDSEVEIDGGAFLLRNAYTGWPRLIPVELDWDLAEKLVDRAESVNRHLKTMSTPDFCGKPRVCRTCRFRTVVCNPPLDFGDGVVPLDDSYVAERFSRRMELAEQGTEFKALDAWCKTYLKSQMGDAAGERTFIIGEVLAAVNNTGASTRVKFFSTKEGANGDGQVHADAATATEGS
jgi:hypothetical protein